MSGVETKLSDLTRDRKEVVREMLVHAKDITFKNTAKRARGPFVNFAYELSGHSTMKVWAIRVGWCIRRY